FIMGQDEDEPSDHSPAHAVTLNPFWIHQAEVTNRMYRTCVEVGVCSEPSQSLWYDDPEYENAPVSGVDWTQAQAYCEWMNGRLPTEAEWELAARGTEADPYPWGEDEPTCDLLNFLDCLIPSVPDSVRSYPLGASEYNLADMAGNVSEWVADWYGEDYYAASPGNNPLGPSNGEDKVVRGSSYLSPVEDTLIVLRSSQNPLQSQPSTGFRCVVNSDTPETAPMCSMLSYEPTWDPMAVTPESQPQPTPGNLTYMYFICGDPLTVVVDADFAVNTMPWASIWVVSSPPGLEPYCGFPPGNKIACGDPHGMLSPGQTVTITWCGTPYYHQSAAPSCPNLYEYNQATGVCEYNPGYGGGQCNGGIIVEGYGCLYPPDDGQCPAGYYSAMYNGDAVCVPAGGPPSSDPDHPLATCPEGLIFNEGNLCCEYPADITPMCPAGFTLDAENTVCVEEPFEWCRSITNTVPDCEPTEEPPLHSCSIWTNRTDCTNALCQWVTVAGPGYCQ
ncbi:MAG: hypothetical protein A2Y93_07980, partial [Chloroflexi bacterium RBG_13_68_17]